MVFTTTTLFKGIACPEGKRCRLTNCIYAHDADSNAPPPVTQATTATTQSIQQPIQATSGPVEPAAKRRKITYDNLADKPPSRADLIRDQLAADRPKPAGTQDRNDRASETDTRSQASLTTLQKPVSPPPTRANSTAAGRPNMGLAAANSKGHKTESPVNKAKIESLNPRLIANDPAGHQKRTLFLKHLHSEMTRLNQAVNGMQDLAYKDLLFLSEQRLIKLALDEEEKFARDQPKVYANVLKQRVAALKKMSVEDWITYIKATFPIEPPQAPRKKEEKVIDTGLLLENEHLILPQLVVANQKPLTAFGYIPTPPTDEQAAEAAAAVEASKNFEVCDRCSARFQMFPERDAEGRLATSGPCFFHPYRKVFPPKEKSDRYAGPKEPYYPCCNEKVGTPGCTRHEDHVFKTSSPARLAAIMPFVNTPENASPRKDGRGNEVRAATFDCEMGYTALGMELIRLTAVSWPSGNMLIDILVRPLGAVIDFNSRFSGVTHESFRNAIPYDDWEKQWQSSKPPPPAESGVLPVVDSPQRARELLCSFITPSTPLIGHAIDNDLNTVRLCHPTIIDTIILYPHPRGLPMRFGLKMLTQRHLNRYIQTGGDRGHDSLEDAIATGDLVRVKVGEKWKSLKNTGWQIANGQLVPPSPQTQSALETAEILSGPWSAADMVEKAFSKVKKRKKASMDGSDDGGGDEEGEDDAIVADAAAAQL